MYNTVGFYLKNETKNMSTANTSYDIMLRSEGQGYLVSRSI